MKIIDYQQMNADFSPIDSNTITGCCAFISGGDVSLSRDVCASSPLVSALRSNTHRAFSVPPSRIANVRKSLSAQPRGLSFCPLVSFALWRDSSAACLPRTVANYCKGLAAELLSNLTSCAFFCGMSPKKYG